MAHQFLDARRIQDAGAFIQSQLEQLDQTFYGPLYDWPWGNFVPALGVTSLGVDFVSYVRTSFAASSGGMPGSPLSFIGQNSTTLPTVSLDMAKVPTKVHPWGQQAAWTIFEAEQAKLTGMPLDMAKLTAIGEKYNSDMWQLVNVGDTAWGVTGLLNNPNVSAIAAPNGAGGNSTWASKTPDEILTDVNTILHKAWANSGYTVFPTRLVIPPDVLASLSSRKVSDLGTMSILTYVLENNIAKVRGSQLEILDNRWLTGSDVTTALGLQAPPISLGTKGRAMAYSKKPEYVRVPTFEPVSLPQQFVGISYQYPQVGVLCELQFVRPETACYLTGI